MQNNNIKKITLHAQEVKLDKQSFIACSTMIGDKWYKVKFRKDCNDIPKVKGLYDLEFDLRDTSFEKGDTYYNEATGETGKSNDVIWIHKALSLRAYTEEELKEINAKKMSEVFKDLPL